MIDLSSPNVGAATRRALHEQFSGDVDLHRCAQRDTTPGEKAVQRLRLPFRAWESIENETILRVRFSDAFLDEADDYLVRDQPTGCHVLLGLFAKLRSCRPSRTQHVTRRDLRNAMRAAKHASLSTLAARGRA
jgi:hypothetical protein